MENTFFNLRSFNLKRRKYWGNPILSKGQCLGEFHHRHQELNSYVMGSTDLMRTVRVVASSLWIEHSDHRKFCLHLPQHTHVQCSNIVPYTYGGHESEKLISASLGRMCRRCVCCRYALVYHARLHLLTFGSKESMPLFCISLVPFCESPLHNISTSAMLTFNLAQVGSILLMTFLQRMRKKLTIL